MGVISCQGRAGHVSTTSSTPLASSEWVSLPVPLRHTPEVSSKETAFPTVGSTGRFKDAPKIHLADGVWLGRCGWLPYALTLHRTSYGAWNTSILHSNHPSPQGPSSPPTSSVCCPTSKLASWVAQLVKESACNVGDPSLILGSGKSHAQGNGYLLQYSCLVPWTDEPAGLLSMAL